MVIRQRGGRARAALVQQRIIAERRSVANLPPTATVREVDGAVVRINDEDEWIGRLGVITKPGDIGVVLPLAGGGRVFAPTEAAITGEDIPVTTDPGAPTVKEELDAKPTDQDFTDLNTAITDGLQQKRDKAVKVPQTEVESSQGLQDLADDFGVVLGDILQEQTTRQNEDGQIRTASMTSRRLQADESIGTTGNSLIQGDIQNPFGWLLDANTDYQLLAHLDAQGSETDGNFNGVSFGLDVPTGATVEGSIVSRVPGVSDRYVRRITSGGLDILAFSANDLAPFDLEIRATIKTAGSGGLLWIMTGGLESGDTVTIMAGSNARLQIAP